MFEEDNIVSASLTEDGVFYLKLVICFYAPPPPQSTQFEGGGVKF